MDLWTPDALLLGPGGAKGFLMLGALLLLEKCKMLKDVKKIVGVSMGAIIGMFLNIGCTVTEILEIGLMTELNEIITTIDVMTIMKNKGLVSHDVFRKRMREKVTQRFGFVPTLKQLYMMTGIELEIVVTNLDKDRPEYFSHQTEPDLCCVEAVLMSMSLPLFFYTYVYKDNIYLDGAVAEPFPIHRLKKDKTLAIRMMGSHIDPKDSFFNYISKVVNCLTSQTRNNTKSKDTKILDLIYEVNDAIGVKLTYEKRVEMVLVGYVRTYHFLKSFQSCFLGSIEKYTNQNFFDSITINFNNRGSNELDESEEVTEDETEDETEEEGEVQSEESENKGDEYLEECFESEESRFDTDNPDEFFDHSSNDETPVEEEDLVVLNRIYKEKGEQLSSSDDENHLFMNKNRKFVLENGKWTIKKSTNIIQ
jgi:predicted acylesterase/phospholipase RssA